MTYPTSPAPSAATGSRTGDMTPSSSASNAVPWTIARSGSRVSKRPSTTRTKATTPRYWSYDESKTSARAGASGSPAGRRYPLHDGVEHLVHARTRLRRDAEHPLRRLADELAELGSSGIRIRLREIDLVRDRDDLEVVVEREVRVGQRLRLDPLRRVDEEQRPLAGLERARDLVAEVDVARSVDQVQEVVAPANADRLGLDRDPALALQVHGVEKLLAHLALGDGAGQLEDAIGERRLAVVDVRDDREVADPIQLHRRSALLGGIDAPGSQQ